MSESEPVMREIAEKGLSLQRWQLLVGVMGVLVSIVGFVSNNTLIMALLFLTTSILLAALPNVIHIEKADTFWNTKISAVVDLEMQYKSRKNVEFRKILGEEYRASLERCLGYAISQDKRGLSEYFRNKIREFESTKDYG
jgi:hypothetical protein